MRRIIERVVTVVTTTTWKISWEADTSRSDDQAETVSNDLLIPDVLSETTQSALLVPSVTETKEVDPPEKENASNQT